MMKFAILIPVFNNLEFTKTALLGLFESLSTVSGVTFDIILVDDGSTDGTSEWVNDHYPDIVVLKGDGNLWWSGGINLGARYAMEELKADYLVLWNNDIEIEKNYFHELVRIVRGLSAPNILGSKICVAEQPDVVWSMGGFFKPRSGKYAMYGYFDKDGAEYEKVREVDWLTGMGTVVPRVVVETIGYWDREHFPQYHGDADFTYRAKLAGFRNIVQPTLKIYNHVKNSGIEHEGKFKQLIKLLTDVRSKTNLKKNLKFYRLYARSPWAYLPLIWIYFKIFGGFLKWKVLSPLKIKKRAASI